MIKAWRLVPLVALRGPGSRRLFVGWRCTKFGSDPTRRGDGVPDDHRPGCRGRTARKTYPAGLGIGADEKFE